MREDDSDEEWAALVGLDSNVRYMKKRLCDFLKLDKSGLNSTFFTNQYHGSSLIRNHIRCLTMTT